MRDVLAPGALDIKEVEVTWLATDNLTINGNYSLADTEYQSEFVIAEGDDPARPAPLFGLRLIDLDGNQLKRIPDDLEWRRWSNISVAARQGVGLLEMDAAQTTAAFGLMAATLSARGFETSRDIMRLEGHYPLHLGRRHGPGRGLLLPHPLTGNHDRVRPPRASGAGWPQPTEPQPCAYGGAHTQRQR